ncbi:MAG: S8 family serine peptidase [Candidatus Eisenbacteria bacterium]
MPRSSRSFTPLVAAIALTLAAIVSTRAEAAEGSAPMRYLVRGALDDAAARARGLSVGAHASGWTTLRVPAGRAGALRSLPGAASIVRAPNCQLLLDLAAVEMRLSLLRTVSEGGVAGPSGSGVLIGIVDTGIDLTHADFRRADGTSRILALWDQTSSAGIPPDAFEYGTEWGAAEIDAGTAVSLDEAGHGTHVSGIAAGNGRAGVAGLDALRYVGVAPEASLCVVKVDFSEPQGASAADIVDAVAYVFAKAAILGMPAVVNLSLGTQEGPHDGTSPLDEMLEAMAGPGRIIVAAAGNEGAVRVHGLADVPAGGTSELMFFVPGYTPSAGAENDLVRLSAWHERADSISVTVVTPGGAILGPVGPGGASFTTVDGHVTVCLGDCTAPGLPAAEISILLRDSLDTAPPCSGTWKLRFTRIAAGGSGRLDAYVANQVLGTGAPSVVWVQGAVTDGTIRSPATSDSVIAVGAHTTKPCWTSLDGSTSCAGAPSSMGQLAFFSSRGPRRDGVLKPDLSAPGFAVVSARSAAVAIDPWDTVPGEAHVAMMGTSMATPAVTGAIALLLARSGWASAGPTQVRDHLRATARADGFTGATPNTAWGYGKLDILSLLSMSPTAAEFAESPRAHYSLSNAAPNPFNPRTSVTLDLPHGARVTAGVHDVTGRRVKSLVARELPAGSHRIAWDGRDDRGLALASGVYYVVISMEGDRVSRKVTLLK